MLKKIFIAEDFIVAVQLELEKSPAGMSEYNLIKNLKLQGYFSYLSVPSLPHELFHAHFILHHVLYLLRDTYLESKKYILIIHTLKMQLLPYSNNDAGLQQLNKLREYYLDLNNFEKTSEDDVYDMLASFWNKVNHFDNREAALAELELKDPVDNATIKKEYRRLIMQHHPDRGGETEKLQKLNDAINSLLN